MLAYRNQGRVGDEPQQACVSAGCVPVVSVVGWFVIRLSLV